VKGVRVLAVVGANMSKIFWDTGVLYVIKWEEIYKEKGTCLESSRKIAYFSQLLNKERPT